MAGDEVAVADELGNGQEQHGVERGVDGQAGPDARLKGGGGEGEEQQQTEADLDGGGDAHARLEQLVRALGDGVGFDGLEIGHRATAVRCFVIGEPGSDDEAGAGRQIAGETTDGETVVGGGGAAFTPGVVEADDLDGEAGAQAKACLLYTSPSPRDQRGSRMPSSA